MDMTDVRNYSFQLLTVVDHLWQEGLLHRDIEAPAPRWGGTCRSRKKILNWFFQFNIQVSKCWAKILYYKKFSFLFHGIRFYFLVFALFCIVFLSSLFASFSYS